MSSFSSPRKTPTPGKITAESRSIDETYMLFHDLAMSETKFNAVTGRALKEFYNAQQKWLADSAKSKLTPIQALASWQNIIANVTCHTIAMVRGQADAELVAKTMLATIEDQLLELAREENRLNPSDLTNTSSGRTTS